ncbi:ATP-dependent DNA helicase RecG [Aeromonas caviae]|uniref:ATP-dependent DNA helicase RecG n=1 Tax=Aeromonas hydrophila TaxID=644 RepID=A0AAX3P392_AERHY|nr:MULTISPECIES: ATP-dependent DNA helicase RecG [Aeromonas]GKQ62380.1 ATP-dependent DNA helicase RecG [Aeromonas caviae]HDT5860614.1 ATP-dependent DNA helicase RecG [Aeromonas hydrophila subsp. hydrophila]MCV9383514.1 ATP-dependent DNA helicase RecG [Aeromonas hydrophila]MDD9227179.1 ATP-dependent DNA helicase RecG [Aeromonas hydrophila]WEA30426.1 ATP-dependent DNA helicase RecG [Aeromonas hydrophila]
MKLDKISLDSLKGVGSKMQEKLERLGLATVQDLLFHLPLRYEDRTQVWPIGDLPPGLHGAVEGEIQDTQLVMGRRRMLVCRISDGTGTLTLRFFNFTAAQKNSLSPGRLMRCFGEVRPGKYGLEMAHPEYKLLGEEQAGQTEEALTPVYPTTEGLRQLTLRSLTDQALAQLDLYGVEELLPAGLYPQQIDLAAALKLLHRPPPSVALALLESGQHPAQQRLVLEELLAHNLSVLKVRAQAQTQLARALKPAPALVEQLLDALPFTPTGAQNRVVAEIGRDLQQSHPMMRLVQGDVGSGKTLVAALAALQAIGNGCQVGLMAPTELLAEQHAINFAKWLEPLGIGVGWLAGKQKGKAREEALAAIADGSVKMVVGTHAIFQEQVVFQRLALVIIDEQHRFGVHQRLALREKGEREGVHPHQLIMTATPIPRTLAMTAYADLDTSIIDELPPGRTPITTVALPDSRRQDVIERVRLACEEGKQAYWVCTLIEESEVLECQAAEDTAAELQNLLPGLHIGLVHGRMRPVEKQRVMEEFKAGILQLLVATTVIEVGVDVPNASLMIIENPERLGLAQLHQLRGRVGRGSVASHCVLLYHAPLSKTAQSRLGVLRETNDGFLIAQRDLELRGPGELLGTRQTGLADLKIADLVRDQPLIPQVQKMARFLMDRHPSHVEPLIRRWLGLRDHYSNA